jgi:hypothetical protein
MNRQTALIVTIATAVLCGCPGLFSCLGGLLTSVISFIPNADINIGGSTDPTAALATGVGGICVGFILVAIPVAVWFFTMRGKSA